MARAFVLAVMFYEPDKKELKEIFNHADIQSIGKDEYIVIEYKRIKLNGTEKLFDKMEVERN